MKIDIEGSEYRLLKDIVKNKNVINGLIIEFHELDLHLDKVSNFVKELDFKVTHVHANNFDRVIDNIPLVLEMTLERIQIMKMNLLNYLINLTHLAILKKRK